MRVPLHSVSPSETLWDLVKLADLDLLHLVAVPLSGILTTDWALVIERLDTPRELGGTVA